MVDMGILLNNVKSIFRMLNGNQEHDLVTNLHLVTEYNVPCTTFLPNSYRDFLSTFVMGMICRQRTLTLLDTWSRLIWDLRMFCCSDHSFRNLSGLPISNIPRYFRFSTLLFHIFNRILVL